MFPFKIQTWSRVARLSYIPCFFSALQSVLWVLRAFLRKGIAYGSTLICHIKDEGVCVLSCFSPVQLFATPGTVALQSLLCPWDSPDKNTGVGCHALLQGIFPTQGLNWCLLLWQTCSLPLVPPGKPRMKVHDSFSCSVLCQTCILFLWLFYWNFFLLFLGEQDVGVGRNMPPFLSI